MLPPSFHPLPCHSFRASLPPFSPPCCSSLLVPLSSLLLFFPLPTTQKSKMDVGIIAFFLPSLPERNKPTECARRARARWAGGQGTPNKPGTPGHTLASGRTKRIKHTRNFPSTPGTPNTPTRQARPDTKHTMHIRHTAGTRGNARARYGVGNSYRLTSRKWQCLPPRSPAKRAPPARHKCAIRVNIFAFACVSVCFCAVCLGGVLPVSRVP